MATPSTIPATFERQSIVGIRLFEANSVIYHYVLGKNSSYNQSQTIQL